MEVAGVISILEVHSSVSVSEDWAAFMVVRIWNLIKTLYSVHLPVQWIWTFGLPNHLRSLLRMLAGFLLVANGIEGSNRALRSRVWLFLNSLGSARVCSPGSVLFWKHSDDEAQSEFIVSWAFCHACVDIAALTFCFQADRVTTQL